MRTTQRIRQAEKFWATVANLFFIAMAIVALYTLLAISGSGQEVTAEAMREQTDGSRTWLIALWVGVGLFSIWVLSLIRGWGRGE